MDAIEQEQWETGTEHELRFWRHWLTSRGADWPDDFARRFDPDAPLPLDGRHIRVPTSGEYHVLDVGSGPVTGVGKRIAGVDVKLTAVDPLGDHYERLLAEVGLQPPVQAIRGHAEDLLSVFPDQRFDLVTCTNALDHSYDPLRALQQMVDVAKPGGDISLFHVQNEGEREGYEGFHSWNFTIEDGRFKIWKPGDSVFPDAVLQHVERIHAEQHDNWISVFIRTAERD